MEGTQASKMAMPRGKKLFKNTAHTLMAGAKLRKVTQAVQGLNTEVVSSIREPLLH